MDISEVQKDEENQNEINEVQKDEENQNEEFEKYFFQEKVKQQIENTRLKEKYKKHDDAKKNYKKILSNLLFIQPKDQALFTKVNNIDCFDITTKFGKKISEKILLQKKISFNLNEIDLEEILNVVKQSSEATKIINIYKSKKEKLFNSKKVLLENPETFEKTKKELIEILKEKMQKSKNGWIQYRRKVIDLNIQENIWELHFATCFVSIKTATKTIYAPVLLKEVQFEDVSSSQISVVCEGTWKINEKLLFVLNEHKFSLDEEQINNSLEDKSIFEFTETLSKYLKTTVSISNLASEFINKDSESINNKNLLLHSGVVLGLFKPSGSNIRKTMLEIINNDEVDSILDPHPDKSIYERNLREFLENKSDDLIRITKTNFSQQKAIISSLIQDTIIWGPPGTGKSQVIANIIANILYQNKTAVVMSQKKAALDVLKKRLGRISYFCFFILNDNKMDKNEFYQYLKNFIDIIENNFICQKHESKKIISFNEIESLDFISKSKANDSYKASVELIKQLIQNTFALKEIFALDNSLKYSNYTLSLKKYMNVLAQINNINQKGSIFKRYPSFIKDNSKKALDIINSLNPHQELNSLVQLSKKTNLETIFKLMSIPETLVHNNIYQSDEQYLIDFLSKLTLKKINNWEKNDSEKFREYKKFASAVRAARMVPYKFINQYFLIIKELFPVIITTPETSFINWKKQNFDYVIIDESSQIFLETGLAVLYLGKIKILSGDTKQMQPSSWFSFRDNEIDENEDVVENTESLLDYAFHKGTFQIMLNQNFRSFSASLMSFSAKHFYDSNLDVIDVNNSNLSKQTIIVENVEGKWQGQKNQVEANKVIEIIYQQMKNFNSIIVVTFNFHQKELIESEIIAHHPEIYQLIEDEKLAIKNIENIQGDEADLVIISVVYDGTTNISSTYICRSTGKNALNVVISRAKMKMIVVKSLNVDTIKPAKSEDFKIFKKWLAFLDMTDEQRKIYSTKQDYPNSLILTNDCIFEQDVIDAIKQNIAMPKKVKLVSQYKVGSKEIDLAFISTKSKFILGIEIDDYKYHKEYDKYLENISLKEFLEFKGYQIYKIKHLDWIVNKSNILKDISSLLSKALESK